MSDHPGHECEWIDLDLERRLKKRFIKVEKESNAACKRQSTCKKSLGCFIIYLFITIYLRYQEFMMAYSSRLEPAV